MVGVLEQERPTSGLLAPYRARVVMVPTSATAGKTLTAILESEAVKVGERTDPMSDGDPIITLDRAVALALEHIGGARRLREAILYDLLLQECRLDTELMQMQADLPLYAVMHSREREHIMDKLDRIAEERRRLLANYVMTMRELHTHLLELLSKHSQLSF